jgi:putative colanic acid biosynthesis acetyltransferase WcaF
MKIERQPIAYVNKLGFANRLARLVWNGVWLVLFRFSPSVLHGWRRLLLRLFGAKLGPGVHVYPSAKVWAPWNLEMGANACLGPQVDCYNVAKVTLGENATISQRAYLCTASHDIHSAGFGLIQRPVIIGKGAWVSAHSFVGPGVCIGESAVVGACAVVVKNVGVRVVVAGNPAQKVGTRKRGK